MELNSFKLYQLSSILMVNMSFLEEQKTNTISFEIDEMKSEKVKVLYSPKLEVVFEEEDGKLKLSST